MPAPILRLDVIGMMIGGLRVRLNDTFRLGAVMVDVHGGKELVMSSATWSALVTEDQRGGYTPTFDFLENKALAAGEAMKVVMVDLAVSLNRKIIDKRRVTRYSDDRVDFICRGISDLVAQMSNLLAMREVSEGSVSVCAKRYAELAAEMKALRVAVTTAEGQFEVAQHQVVQLMGAT